MINRRRVSGLRLLAFAALLLPAAAWTQTRPAIVEQLAKTYGLDSFGQIEAARYTFNIEIPALKFNLSRTWTWEPKTGQVTYESKDKDGKPVKVTYNRNQLSTAPDNVKNEIEPGFVNDNYWFIFPFHAYWDTTAAVTVKDKQKLPLGKSSATLVSVKYPAEVGGYTPGDTWELWVGSNNRVQEFFYHRGGPKKPSEVKATWVGYKKAGPLLISTEHRGTADGGPFHVFFTNVAVKLTGSDNWVEAQ